MNKITQDPRPDLFEDHHLWADILALCNRLDRRKYEELKIMMGYFRRAECKLRLENGRLYFSFNHDNLNEHLIKRAKEIIRPYKEILKDIFNKVARKHTTLDPKNWEEELPF